MVHTFIPKGLVPVAIGQAICDVTLFVGSPDWLLDYDGAVWVMGLGDDLPVGVTNPALLLAYDNKAMNLVCPY